MESTIQVSGGCSIAYTLNAADSPNRVALIHSLALDRTIWDGVVAELDGEASVLAYDCRGHGRSSQKPGPFTMEQFARDLAQLLDHVGWPSAVVAGCSMGGGVAQAFGGLFPDRTTGLGLIDTTAWYGAEAPTQWRQRAAIAKANGLAGMVEFQTTRWFGDAFRAARKDLVERATNVFLANDLNCYASTCEMLGDADLRPYLSGFRMPVAVIVGEEDYATPVAAAKQMHEAIAGSTLTILQGRHLTPIECPEKIATELMTLFESGAKRQAAN
ncbi:MAG: alpha/beta fold hydrolase [Bryobacteraceae bacterium]